MTEDLTAVETVFGWVIQGSTTVHTRLPQSTCALLLTCGDPEPECNAEDLWKLDTLGITSPEPTASHVCSTDLRVFEARIAKSKERYEVPLMIKEPGLPPDANNKATAVHRLRAQHRRFSSAPEVLRQYDNTIREYFVEGRAEQVTSPDPDRNLYYLPHHAVVRSETATTKIRIVFDASSYIAGQPSFNNVLSKGPNMNSDLLHLLLTFRNHPVALTADIRKAYLQILIRPEDRDALRFLRVSDLPSASNPYPPLQEWRMTRVPFGAASSPFLLAATLQHHFRSVSHRYPATAARLSTSCYVDDLVVGCRDVAEAQTFYKDTRAILQEAGMDIRKWASNSPVLQEKYLNDGIAYDNVSELGSVLRVLDVPWDRQFDGIWVPARSVQASAKDAPSTKRGVLQVFSRLYDPWGFLFPFAITARLLFQTLWKEKWPWDSPLEPPLLDAWHAWVNDLATLSEVRQSRWVLGSQHSLLDLQVFADASPRAYGVVVYAVEQVAQVRSRTSDGRIKVFLLIAKGRVAPLKTLTLPRLELLGCLLAARIFCRIISSLPIAALQATFWTDSTIALHWVKNDTDKWPPFVAARTTEIRRLTNPQQWFHCKGKHNPADLLNRGVSAKALLDSQLWWSGPRWLSQEFDSAAAPVVDAEVFPTEEVCCVAVATRMDLPLRLADSLKHILWLTAHVLRYIHNLRYPQSRTTGPLSADELTSAELVGVRNTQAQAFPEEVAALQRSAPVSRTSTLLTLQPFLHETAVLRVGGRLQQMDDSIDIRHLIFLPSKHRFSVLVILDTHERLHHAGVQDTLSELRQRYWILKGRQTVRRTLHTCPCKYRQLSPETAPVAPLPIEKESRRLIRLMLWELISPGLSTSRMPHFANKRPTLLSSHVVSHAPFTLNLYIRCPPSGF
ncbi:uncharacterized protein LOC135384591 [Ornithodoros turicata]|uniref:uncharacterized protein LOC135384591 n=1 Tax=Ornithodoros turicata TaxID=34597 RepID=UPI00313A47C2